MTDDGFYMLEISVGGHLHVRQHIFCVENVQTLVFHGSHVEIVNRDHIEQVQIIYPSIYLFIPLHGFLQGLHRMAAFVNIIVPGVNMQGDIPTIHGSKMVLKATQLARDDGKQISRFWKRVIPERKMSAEFQIPLINQVTVTQ